MTDEEQGAEPLFPGVDEDKQGCYESDRPFEDVGKLGHIGELRFYITEDEDVVVWDRGAEEVVHRLDREEAVAFKELLEESFRHPSRDDNPYNRVGGGY